MAERRAHPAEDVISDLVTAEVDGERLTDEAIYSFLRLLLPAGAETTYRSSGNLLYLLLTHPDQLEAVRDDRSLLPQAIEEALRFEPPLLTINRTTTCEVEIGGRDPRRRARASRRTSARPTTTRRAGTTPRPSTSSGRPSPTSPSPTARTCAWACTWPAWRHGRWSTASSTGCPTWRSTRATADPHIRGEVFRSPTSLPVTFTPAA